jgi:hypothetical protein
LAFLEIEVGSLWIHAKGKIAADAQTVFDTVEEFSSFRVEVVPNGKRGWSK